MMHGSEHPRPMADDWRQQALCRAYPVDVFYPRQPGILTDKAKAICARCPVSAECLADAMAPPFEHDGIRGGLTADERRAMRRRELYAARKARKVGAS